MGGFGGALKNVSIGLASSNGKKYIHTGGKEKSTYLDLFSADHDSFLMAMGDACKTITDYYKENIVYINAMVNMSVDCDCCAKAKDPCMQDIGILASTDPVALDQACADAVNALPANNGSILDERECKCHDHFTNIHPTTDWKSQISHAEKLGLGTKEYNLIEV
jgi:uncharacterized Fe-S center protein